MDLSYNLCPATGHSRWYAVYCKPRKEAVAEMNLHRQGFQVYLPRIQLSRHRRGRWIEVIEPLFPRYLFVYLDVGRQSIAPIRSTIGVTGMVCFDEHPAVVPQAVIDVLVGNEDKETGLHPYGRPLFRHGDTVRFLEGPFAGLEGIYNAQSGEDRVVVLLDLLGKLNNVKVPKSWIIPVN